MFNHKPSIGPSHAALSPPAISESASTDARQDSRDEPDAGGLRPVAEVATAVLGDACVVYHPPSKVVVRLNDTGSALWLDLCEGEPLGADHVDFLHRLASLGLVTPSR